MNDVIATEDGPQTLVGRFMYGPLDMVTLTGEKVKNSDMIYVDVCAFLCYADINQLIACVIPLPLSGGYPAHDTASVGPLGAL